ncbi:glycine zipper family protein [Virgibacillus sp. W0181]|uniref:glycine zipper family protein n=1 Tax=Virgibacillus sp. W0181 TaxID=3391581 RepID=UPI003F488E0F
MSRDKKNTYLATGIGIGLPLGAAIGLIIMDNLAIGAGIGLILGIVIGAAVDSNKTNKE